MSATPDPGSRHRDVDLAGAGIALAIALAAGWIGIWPMFEQEDNRNRLAIELALSRAQLAGAQGEYGQVRRAIASTSAQLLASAVVLHTADRLVERQEQITRTASSGGIALEQLTVGAAQHGDLLDTIPMRLSGHGDYPRVVEMMHKLRTDYPDMAITTFQLLASEMATVGSDNTSQTAPVVRFELDVAWYTARPDPA